MDLYLVIDGSEAFQSSKTDAIAWINERVVDRLLMEGDRVNILAAGDKAELVYSGDVSDSGEKAAIKDTLTNLAATGKSADFSRALSTVSFAIANGNAGDRISYTMLVTASAEGLESALAGDAQGLLRWFRTEKYEQWQVLVVAPDIGRRVNQAAAAYMNSLQRQ
ncbi:MAG: VWA domain-containing protein [Treponema sp.]|jgi:hypothetical protein|nr:VWA domain-containing protein [Treponema sp.]